MPKLTDGMSTLVTSNNYHFTAANIEDLGAAEYTLVTLACDVSSSVDRFRDQLEACIKTVLESCRRSPRSQNLLLRLCAFSSGLKELHGFRELDGIRRSDYDQIIKTGGFTALFDAGFEAVDATARYGKALMERDYEVNGLVFIITDGMDNQSKRKPEHISQLITKIRRSEMLENIDTVLIGVTSSGSVSAYLERFRKQAGLGHYIAMGEASEKSLARLAGFMSRSIALKSQALGSGTAGNVIPIKI